MPSHFIIDANFLTVIGTNGRPKAINVCYNIVSGVVFAVHWGNGRKSRGNEYTFNLARAFGGQKVTRHVIGDSVGAGGYLASWSTVS